MMIWNLIFAVLYFRGSRLKADLALSAVDFNRWHIRWRNRWRGLRLVGVMVGMDARGDAGEERRTAPS